MIEVTRATESERQARVEAHNEVKAKLRAHNAKKAESHILKTFKLNVLAAWKNVARYLKV